MNDLVITYSLQNYMKRIRINEFVIALNHKKRNDEKAGMQNLYWTKCSIIDFTHLMVACSSEMVSLKRNGCIMMKWIKSQASDENKKYCFLYIVNCFGIRSK